VKQGKLYKVSADTGRTEPFFDAKKLADALAKLPGIDASTAGQISSRAQFQMNHDKTGFWFEHEGNIYYAAFSGEKAVRLTKGPGKVELVTFSPDGRLLAFVRGQDLFAVEIATQKERQLTTDGGGKISNGKADWVYYEEIFDRNERAYWWSPDSKQIAFFRFDDAPVHEFTVVDNIPLHQ